MIRTRQNRNESEQNRNESEQKGIKTRQNIKESESEHAPSTTNHYSELTRQILFHYSLANSTPSPVSPPTRKRPPAQSPVHPHSRKQNFPLSDRKRWSRSIGPARRPGKWNWLGLRNRPRAVLSANRLEYFQPSHLIIKVF